ncbi:MAG TPA: low molecular weight protein-tyrosine-phosphatase [Candidatus Caenarcaniphilales bacterium]
MTQKLLFVCLGNICRSPTAENIMNHLIKEAHLQTKIICDSAGTSNYHIGEPPDHRMALAAKQREIHLHGQARQLQASDLADFDWILAMDQENYRDILSLDSAKQYEHKVRLICEFCTQHPDTEVPDPYFGGLEGFQYVIDLLLDACAGLLGYLTQVKAVS